MTALLQSGRDGYERAQVPEVSAQLPGEQDGFHRLAFDDADGADV
jgi:hypothetical protein